MSWVIGGNTYGVMFSSWKKKMKMGKHEKPVCNLNDKKQILNIKQVLNRGLNLEKVHKMIKFN